MEQDNQPKDKEMTQRISTISAIMGIVMTAIYMGMSFLLLFTNLFVGKVPEWVRYMMGVVFFLYGIYRGYRVYKSK
jgi:membrane protein YdbS with pleckstrin-like domain